MLVSVVISTLDRAESLVRTIDSLHLQTHDQVELVVVNGPSTDGTAEVLAAIEHPCKRLSCPVANLSMSRNIGIRAAAGEVLAFIDDDAIPEPTWLEEALPEFADPEVAGVGGLVFDNTGLAYQYTYSSADRLGHAEHSSKQPFDSLCFPGTWRFPYLQGTNAIMRRDALAEIGLFDEEYEYYLDETDVCLRLIDAGFVLRQLHGAPVHHKFLPSDVRNEHRVVRNWFPVVKNRVYFGLKHARPERTLGEIIEDNQRFVEQCLADVRANVALGLLPADEPARAHDQMGAALEVGLRRGLDWSPPARPAVALDPPAFVPFPTAGRRPGRKCIVMVSRDYPPEGTGGVATLTAAAAAGLASAGNEVRVVASTPGPGRVDLEGSVWVHRIVDGPPDGEPVDGIVLPPHAAARMRAVEREVRRIGQTRPVDAVYGPIWDSEALAVATGTTFPIVTHAETTMGLSLQAREDWRTDARFMDQFATPLVAAERAMVRSSIAIHAISAAIGRTVETDHDADPNVVTVVPIALPPTAHDGPVAAPRGDAQREPDEPVRVLFVGRLEPRKGLDALLPAVSRLVAARPDVVVDIVGNDSIPIAGGGTYRARFEAEASGLPGADRVRFHGQVDDTQLHALYAACDIFVAPSRYESFGLVFLEAMRYGKAVIGTSVGGVPEIVRDGIDGLLVPPDDPAALAGALEQLVADPVRRAEMGLAGRSRVTTDLSLDRYVAGLDGLFGRIAWLRSSPDVVASGAGEPVRTPDGQEAIVLSAGTEIVVRLPAGGSRATAVVVTDRPAAVWVGTTSNGRSVVLDRTGVHRVQLEEAELASREIRFARAGEDPSEPLFAGVHVLEEVVPCVSPS